MQESTVHKGQTKRSDQQVAGIFTKPVAITKDNSLAQENETFKVDKLIIQGSL